MTAIRIGDTERDAAISALADHYAAGRLSKDEYDERADRVNAARFDDDLAPLFADLPARDVAEHTSRSRRMHPAMRAAPLLWLAPLLTIGAIAVVAAVAVLITPWLLFAVFWFACAGLGCGNRNRHRHYHHRTWARTRRHWQRA